MRRPVALRLHLALAASSKPTGEPWAPPTEDVRPNGPMVWIHSSGADTMDKAVSLAKHLQRQRDDIAVLLTTSDPTRINEADGIKTSIIPSESPQDCVAFMEFWSPELALWVGSNLKPVLIDTCRSRETPLILIDATETMNLPNSISNGRGLRRATLRQFEHIYTDGDAAAQSLNKLLSGDPPITTLEPLQPAPPVLECDDSMLQTYKEKLLDRPVWLAACTHPDDQATVVLAHRQALRANHRLLLVILPDDINNAVHMAQDLTATGWHTALLSKDQIPSDDIQILIVDVPDQLGLWYRLAPVTFVGGTMQSTEAANPYHPANLGSAILHGPNTRPFENVFNTLVQHGAARRVRTPEQLLTALNDVLQPHIMASMAHAAWQVTTEGAEATDQVLAVIETKFDALGF